MNNVENLELQELVKLSEQFIQITDDLLKRGAITKEQYDEMAKNKIEFVKNFNEKKALN